MRCSTVIITFSSTLSLHCFDLTTSPNGGKSALHIVGQPLPPEEPELHMHKIPFKKLHVPISPHSSCKGCSNNSNTSNLQSTVPFKKKHSTGKTSDDGLIGPFFWANQDDVESLTGASSFVGSGCGVLTEESTGSSRTGSSCAMTSVMPRTSRNAKDHFMKDLVGHHH